MYMQALLLSKSIAALATIAVVSFDLGVDYSDLEKKIYHNWLVQLIVVLAVLYSELENVQSTLILAGVWLFLKHASKLSSMQTI